MPFEGLRLGAPIKNKDYYLLTHAAVVRTTLGWMSVPPQIWKKRDLRVTDHGKLISWSSVFKSALNSPQRLGDLALSCSRSRCNLLIGWGVGDIAGSFDSPEIFLLHCQKKMLLYIMGGIMKCGAFLVKMGRVQSQLKALCVLMSTVIIYYHNGYNRYCVWFTKFIIILFKTYIPVSSIGVAKQK